MAEVVACLAELQPRAVARNISLIMPYLACNTYAIRSRCAASSVAAMLTCVKQWLVDQAYRELLCRCEKDCRAGVRGAGAFPVLLHCNCQS